MIVKSILFVCTGNICRSPLAEGIFRHLAVQNGDGSLYRVDSAGTGGWHQGELPDKRSIKVAAAHGIDISHQRARKLVPGDFEAFDLLLGMDSGHLRAMKEITPAGYENRVHLFADYAAGQDFDVPDPYYDGQQEFNEVYEILFSGCELLMDRLRSGRVS